MDKDEKLIITQKGIDEMKKIQEDEARPEKILTEEESQQQYIDKQQKEFFDKDDEIIEVNWD